MSTITHRIDLGDLGEVDLLIEYEYTPGAPGKCYGPPEACYPPEDDEISFISVKLWGEYPTGQFFEKLAQFLEDDDALVQKIVQQEQERDDEGDQE
jgi:hypothetical protein